MISSQSHDISAAAVNLFFRLISENYVGFVGSRHAYPSQEWAIQKLFSITDGAEIFTRYLEMTRMRPETSHYLSIGLNHMTDDQIRKLVLRLSKGDDIDEILWSKTPVDKAAIVLSSSVSVSKKFPFELAQISLEGVPDFIRDRKISKELLDNTIRMLPTVILNIQTIPKGFEAVVFGFCIEMFAKIDKIDIPLLSFAESICVRHRSPLFKANEIETIKKDLDASHIYDYIQHFRNICYNNNCGNEFDSKFANEKYPIAILCRTLFETNFENLSSDCIKAFEKSDTNDSGYLFIAMHKLLDSLPDKVKEYTKYAIDYGRRDIKMSIKLMIKCFEMNQDIAGPHIITIVSSMKDVFMNIISSSDALKLFKCIKQTQHLSSEESSILSIPLYVFDPDDILPSNLVPSEFSVTYMLDVLQMNTVSVKQLNRVLDFLAKAQSAMNKQTEERLYQEICNKMCNENTLETNKKLTAIIRLLSLH